ncbi:efflux RND transporter periplasmic adaptor subunit [Micropruina glycogenica]|uniref:Multidrug resistance protein MdtA-like C-terminal permuted SH3 domain-containing protein n=1 Tax=Micropruina glycogenica TaxID=75385 RepID=A0A2N9JB28_9ACTN|nr:efflux RND transporter periplasmic adaptor subunit [Micropruina glycogenica]SPD85352.1 conserved exported protein of unknown function [Micropruina glycogenica]
MAINGRLRAVIIAGTALAVVGGVGWGVAVANPSSQTRYVTATAGTGDVTQTYTTSGTIARTNTSEASFAVDGTVSSVKVAVGDQVEAGDVLAVLKKGPLQLAVLDAETSVAEAKANLYSAQNPTSTSSRTGSSGSSSSSSGSGSSGSGSSGSGGSGSGAQGGVTINPAPLLAATTALTTAVAAEEVACEPVFGAVPEPTASPSPSTSESPSASPSPSETTTETASPSAEPTPTESESPSASPSATVEDQDAIIEANDPTDAELKACGEARAQVKLATANLQTVVQQLVQPSGNGGTGGQSGTGSSNTTSGSSSTKSGSSSSSSTTTATVSAAQVASAKAKLLQAEQALQAAQDDLDNAELLAPIAGTVGTVELSKGSASSAGAITIVGSGNAQVSFELPLATRTLVENGQKVTVTPAGSTKALAGTITSISAVETSGTAGDTPTYTTVVTVSDADGLLASGAKASVTIPVASATNAVRVPASAVTPTGTGTATVQVLASGSSTASTVQVTTGAVGGGWVEIKQGISAGDTVVLADNTAELPTNTNNNQRRTTTTATAQATTAAQSGGGSSTQPSAQPTATASR